MFLQTHVKHWNTVCVCVCYRRGLWRTTKASWRTTRSAASGTSPDQEDWKCWSHPCVWSSHRRTLWASVWHKSTAQTHMHTDHSAADSVIEQKCIDSSVGWQERAVLWGHHVHLESAVHQHQESDLLAVLHEGRSAHQLPHAHNGRTWYELNALQWLLDAYRSINNNKNILNVWIYARDMLARRTRTNICQWGQKTLKGKRKWFFPTGSLADISSGFMQKQKNALHFTFSETKT